jgi:hypothetical protein
MKRTKHINSVSLARYLLVAFLMLGSSLAVPGVKADTLTFDLRVEKGRVPANARLIRVKQGDVVRLRWSSDRPIAVHLHGYDVETKVTPDKVAEMTFTARATGRFSVEEHKPQSHGGHTHGAPLVWIEVHPR